MILRHLFHSPLKNHRQALKKGFVSFFTRSQCRMLNVVTYTSFFLVTAVAYDMCMMMMLLLVELLSCTLNTKLKNVAPKFAIVAYHL